MDFRLRGKIEELDIEVKNVDRLLRLDPADLSFRGDEKTDTNTFAIDGVAGIDFTTDFGALRLLPFVYYQRTEIDDSSATDVHVVTPGLFLDYRGLYAVDVLRFDTSFDGSVPLDLEQDSRRVRGRGRVAPTIKTFCGYLFGEELSCTGPLILRPEFNFIAETAWVAADGDSTALQGATSYLGLGGDLGLSARLPTVPWLDALTLKSGIRDLRMVAGNTEIDDVLRWYASLFLSPPQVPNVAVEVSYVDGDNPETFQNERFYKVALGLRF